MPKALSSEESKYVKAALRAGTTSTSEIALILLLARTQDKTPVQVQTLLTEIKVGIQQSFGDMAHIPDPNDA